MKKTVLTALLASCLFTSSFAQEAAGVSANPFMSDWNTPYGVPAFEKIKNEHFKPAFIEGMRQQQQQIDAIVRQRSVPTFENTIAAMDYSGALLTRVSTVFYNINSANTNDEIQRIAKELAPLTSKHNDDIYLNAALFGRVKQVYDRREQLQLTPEQATLLEDTYKSFVRSGANLPADKQERMRKINGELSLAQLAFGQNLLAETNSFQLFIDNQKDLAGLPASLVAVAAADAKAAGKPGQWLFTLQNPSVMPFLQYADNRALREKIWRAYSERGNNGNDRDNKVAIQQILKLRTEKAQLLGHKSHADYVLEETMAKTPENVYKLLNEVNEKAIPVAQAEAKELQAMMRKDAKLKRATLQPWDWRYYAEKVRQSKYALNEEEIRSYFELNKVRDGVFMVCDRLYGLQFRELEGMPTYHSEAKAYEVTEKNGKLIGVLYMDFFPRASKRGGAWMTSYRKQMVSEDGKFVTPVISIVCNFSKPAGDMPALLTFDEVTTFFHEFGHALHGLLSNCQYPGLSGTSVPRDFVELPSQIMENWGGEGSVMQEYAKHHKTGEAIPAALLEKMDKASKFNQGFATMEYLAASLLDMGYHTITDANKNIDVLKFETETMKKAGLISEIIPRYRSTYFNHIFAGGYSSGYYSYMWSEVLDADAYAAFKETGNLFDAATAKSFRTNVLEKGGSEDPMKLYKAFRGKEPSIAPLLERRGLNSVAPKADKKRSL